MLRTAEPYYIYIIIIQCVVSAQLASLSEFKDQNLCVCACVCVHVCVCVGGGGGGWCICIHNCL